MKNLDHGTASLGIVVLLAGCAGMPAQPPVSAVSPGARLNVLVLPSTMDDASLQRLFHAGEKQVTSDVLADDRARVERQVEAELKEALALADLPQLRTANVVSPDDAQAGTIGQPLDAPALAALRAQYPADAYLRVEVTDYGQTPKSWKSAYVTFEVVTTLAIAGALYVHKVSRPLAGVYVLEEGVEEFSEGYAGFWMVNRLSRPVRIEADLVDGRTGVVLWHDSETGMADWEWKHLWHMDKATQDALLTISTHKMADALVKELEGQ